MTKIQRDDRIWTNEELQREERMQKILNRIGGEKGSII